MCEGTIFGDCVVFDSQPEGERAREFPPFLLVPAQATDAGLAKGPVSGTPVAAWNTCAHVNRHAPIYTHTCIHTQAQGHTHKHTHMRTDERALFHTEKTTAKSLSCDNTKQGQSYWADTQREEPDVRV